MSDRHATTCPECGRRWDDKELAGWWRRKLRWWAKPAVLVWRGRLPYCPECWHEW